MKLLYNFATVLSFLAVFHQPFAHAAKEDTAVFYNDQDHSVDITDHTLCIPLQKDTGVDVASIVFGVAVTCHTYGSKDCSSSPLESTPLSFDASTDITPDKFGGAAPNGAIKCT